MKYVMVTSKKDIEQYQNQLPNLVIIKKTRNLMYSLSKLKDDVILIKYGAKLCNRFRYRAKENIAYLGSDKVISFFNFTALRRIHKPIQAHFLKDIIALYIPQHYIKEINENTPSKWKTEKRIGKYLDSIEVPIYPVSPSLAQWEAKPSIWFIEDIIHPFNLIYVPELLPYKYDFLSTTFLLSKISGTVTKKELKKWDNKLYDLSIMPPKPLKQDKAIIKAARKMNCPTIPILVQKT